MKNYQAPKVRQRISYQHILAFFRACWYLGLVKPGGRWQFWAMLVWAFFRRPRLFPLAVELAIDGYHFRKVTEHIK